MNPDLLLPAFLLARYLPGAIYTAVLLARASLTAACRMGVAVHNAIGGDR